MKINELEKLLGISKANLRYYESEGLISPKRSENGYRSYTDEDAALLKKIIVYRKLGVTIADIKAVINNEKQLNEVISASISNMQRNIEMHNIAIDICSEIVSKSISDSDFDADYFWNEIENRELKGEEFIDIGNIDITPFKNRKRAKALVIALAVLFLISTAYSFICNYAFLSDNNENYQTTVTEVKTSDIIDTVKVDETNGLIYVCYNNATCVNVYDFSGTFRWAVSTPSRTSRGHTYFHIDNDRLYIDNENDVFVYNSITGEYIERRYADLPELISIRENSDTLHLADVENAEKYGITFDIYNAYLTRDGGEKAAFVERPIYTLLQSDTFGFVISLVSGISLALIAFISKIKATSSLELSKEDVGGRARKHRIFNITLIILYLLFGITNFAFIMFKGISLAVGIFPATAFMIASSVISDASKKRYNTSEQKYTAVSFHFLTVIYVLLFISVLISIILF